MGLGTDFSEMWCWRASEAVGGGRSSVEWFGHLPRRSWWSGLHHLGLRLGWQAVSSAGIWWLSRELLRSYGLWGFVVASINGSGMDEDVLLVLSMGSVAD